MRLESQRTLHLPGTPEEVWPLISDPSRLPVLAPEIEDAWHTRGGLVRVLARVGRRRRGWDVKPTVDEARRRIELTSATEGVRFELAVDLERSGAGGCQVRVRMELEPPEVWKAAPQPGGIPRRVVHRLLLSVLLFVLSAFGVVELPSLALPPVAAAFAYAVVGLSFVIGAALLSSAHRPRRTARRRLLPRLGGGGGGAPKAG